jgi:Dolichyl-phosphate-mannose-protein mannosyltransferase
MSEQTSHTTPSSLWWGTGLLLVVLIAVVLRLKGIHDPILDHPGWRQGDTASIARNFLRLNFNIMYPQTTYNGPPPNYVELELQIIPFFAATMYKIFGIHEVFGRLLSIGFSVGTVVVLAFFGRWLFSSALAGSIAAFFFAAYPGSVYYGRTFAPDTAMVFFLTAALYAASRFLLENRRMDPRALARATALLTFAYLAKPVAVVGVVPVLCAIWERARSGLTTRVTALGVLVIVPLLILWLYDRRIASYAEWHWASGITRLHVLPALQASVSGLPAFVEKLAEFRDAIGMLRATMLGTAGFLLTLGSFVALRWIAARTKSVLWGWLAAGLVYVFVVVTVERVDYYLLLLVPLCALVTGGALAAYVRWIAQMNLATAARYSLTAVVPVIWAVVLFGGIATAAPYYSYNKAAYRNAVALDRTLDRNALVVIGHYGPDVQYYVDRFGWEEDPALWTPFDEESAIRKGARYFISIEDNRLRRNTELCAWMQRFPVLDPHAQWPVYQTDLAKIAPGSDAFWRAFRAAERVGHGRAFLAAHGVCEIAKGR